jgi:Tetratricopeptide repeat
MVNKRRRKLGWLASLWPGFSHLWNRGSWAGLLLALGFTLLLNVLLVTSLVWTEWMTTDARLIVCGLLAALWFVAWLESRADWRRYVAEMTPFSANDGHLVPEICAAAGRVPAEERDDRLFAGALRLYLQGDWVTCEQVLRRLLRYNKGDVEARLMLATLWRHLGRFQEAHKQLSRLEQLEAASPWLDEITHEREQLQQALLDELPQESFAVIPTEVREAQDSSSYERNSANQATHHQRIQLEQEQQTINPSERPLAA